MKIFSIKVKLVVKECWRKSRIGNNQDSLVSNNNLLIKIENYVIVNKNLEHQIKRLLKTR